MRSEDKIIHITQRTGLLLFGITEYPVMVQITEPRRRIGGMIEHIGNEEDRAQHDGREVGPLVRSDLAMPDKIQAGEQQDGRARIQDRMEEGKAPGIETQIHLSHRH